MPANKKPRKAYHRRKISYGYLPEDIDRVRDAYFQTRYAMLSKLPSGTAELDELMCMLDSINVTIISLTNRRDMDKEQKLAARAVLVDGNNAAASIIRRGYESKHFVATGDEMRKINDAGGIAFPYIDESLQNCPGIFLREWHTMKKFIQKVRPLDEVKCLTTAKVRRSYERTHPN